MMRLPLTVLLAVLVAGCGYSTSGNLPNHIKSVAVPVFKNKTQEPAVENTITAAVVNAFTTSGKLKVVPADQADAILEGEVVGYDVQTVSVDQRINVRQYRLVVTLNLQFRDIARGEHAVPAGGPAGARGLRGAGRGLGHHQPRGGRGASGRGGDRASHRESGGGPVLVGDR